MLYLYGDVQIGVRYYEKLIVEEKYKLCLAS